MPTLTIQLDERVQSEAAAVLSAEKVVTKPASDDLTSLPAFGMWADRMEQFKKRLDTDDIFCRPAYRLPKFITPVNVGGALDKSLYTSEVAMNNFEQELIAAVAAQDTIKWWHKIAERKDYSFHLNGFINHYPDFLVMTHSGKAILIEAKGDNLDNSDSVAKLFLGNRWVEKAGAGFQYFMVFQTKDIKIDKSYALDEFIGLVGKM